MPEEYYQNLTIRFFLDELSPQEQEELMNWVVQSEQNHELFKSIERTLDKTAHLPTQFDSQQAYSKLAQRLKLSEEDTISTPRQSKHIFISALFFVLLLTGCFYFFYLPKFNPGYEAQTDIYKEITTPKGQKSILTFPDGSRVVLNSESTIKYPPAFNGPLRKIFLTGEGFFEVTRDTAKPFVVITGNLQTKVLGTSFNIKSFPTENEIKITVSTGRVAVSQNTKTKTGQKLLAHLIPGHQLAYQKNSQVTELTEVDVSQEIAWKESRLIFKNQTFRDIATVLSRTYNVDFTYDPKTIGNCRFTSRFNARASLKEVLRALAITGDFQYEMKNQTIIIKSNGC